EEAGDDRARVVEAPARDEEPGERDHRVAAPVGEPGVAGDDRAAAVGAGDDEVLGGRLEARAQGILAARAAPAELGLLGGGDAARVPARRPQRRDDEAGAVGRDVEL